MSLDDPFADPLHATYSIEGDVELASTRAQALCVEQTIEFPPELVPRTELLQRIVARVVRLEALDERRTEVEIEFPNAVVGEGDLPQLLNVLFGNISLQPGIRLVDVSFPRVVLDRFRGPRYGRAGIRRSLGVSVKGRPLLATALKPMGLSAAELAAQARAVVEGGVDIIKDDHGLVDQVFCPFEERVKRCAAAVAEAAARRGRPCLYFVNVTAPSDRIRDRALFAREQGAGGVVIAPGLVGLDVLRQLADDDDLGIPIASHPSFQGAFTTTAIGGIAHGVLYGVLNRLAGADITIFPSYGGRFAFTEAECRDLVQGTSRLLGGLAPILPAPAGGMTLSRMSGLIDFYGRDVILLVGGDLHRHGANLKEGCRRFLDLIES